jgi:hypothetical protein
VFTVIAQGTPALTYQWFHNGVALSNGGEYSGVHTTTLKIQPVGYPDAGNYSVTISNPCGSVSSRPSKLTVTRGWPWSWGWWNFAQVDNPLAATVGPDLILSGSNTLAITSGTTADFGLPELGGQVANVLYVPALPGDTFIQLPLIAPPGSNSVSSYTLLMDVYTPTNSAVTNTLFEIGNLGTNGQDGLSLRAIEGVSTTQITASGTVGGEPMALVEEPLAGTDFTRVALVMDQPDDNASGEATLTLYVNGEYANSISFTGVPHVPVLPISFLSGIPATLLSSPEGTSGEVYASSIQFHATAMTSEMIAGLGSPDNSPPSANDTSVGPQPALSATMSNGIISFSWIGDSYVLQEATAFSGASFFGVWSESELPFTESLVAGEIVTTAVVIPATEGPSKFYRLIFSP